MKRLTFYATLRQDQIANAIAQCLTVGVREIGFIGWGSVDGRIRCEIMARSDDAGLAVYGSDTAAQSAPMLRKFDWRD